MARTSVVTVSCLREGTVINAPKVFIDDLSGGDDEDDDEEDVSEEVEDPLLLLS